MKQPSDRNALPYQRVIELSRFARFQYVVLHAMVIQPLDGVGGLRRT
jgi:hypothetical protein